MMPQYPWDTELPMTQPTEALTVEELDEFERDYQLEHIDTGVRSGRLPAICAAARAHIEGGQKPMLWCPKCGATSDDIPSPPTEAMKPTHWQPLPEPPK